MTPINPLWLPAPTDLTLLQDNVHIWKINLDIAEVELQNLRQTLSEDEQHRADRFYQKQHRHRFTAGRGILRTILSRYLGIEPHQVIFEYEPLGKPKLADSLNASKLCFNLSHSQDLALCAVSCDRTVGIDLEYIRPMSTLLSLAKQFFAVSEYAVIESLAPPRQREMFYRYWTCKEAYLKATGVGLSQLREIEVCLSATEPARLTTDSEWSLLEIAPEENFAAAIAVQGFGFQLQYWQY
ncbi:MAG: 4'-phosphopantetheinyl transferase superfamily protein [Nostocaceae cyanobacterium]|nr:4'-phosphopantetheinyl transferase superfamily protein [Nostocaceae cyanobacterium]